MKKSMALLPLLAASLLAPAHAQAQDPLYEAAKAEKTLVLWPAGPTTGYEAAAKAFEAKYPGIKIEITGGFSNVLNAKVEEQFKSRQVTTDVVVFQTVQDLVGWNKRGLLLRFKPDGFDKVPPGQKDKDGAWIAVNTNPIFYAYNTEQVKAEDVPTSADDFLKPRWKGRLITAYPADDDATLYAFHTIVSRQGWRYMDRYMAQQPKFIQGHLGVTRSLASGESLVGFDNTIGSTLQAQRAGGKLALAAPRSEPVPVFFTSEAILKDAPHPNAAKLFVSFYLSPEWQRRIGTYSSRADVPAPEGLKPLSSYRLANGYLKFMTDAKRVAALRQRYEKYTGPVTNAGGVK